MAAARERMVRDAAWAPDASRPNAWIWLATSAWHGWPPNLAMPPQLPQPHGPLPVHRHVLFGMAQSSNWKPPQDEEEEEEDTKDESPSAKDKKDDNKDDSASTARVLQAVPDLAQWP